MSTTATAAPARFDWGLAAYLGVIVSCVLWLALSVWRAYARQREATATQAAHARRLDEEREAARARQAQVFTDGGGDKDRTTQLRRRVATGTGSSRNAHPGGHTMREDPLTISETEALLAELGDSKGDEGHVQPTHGDRVTSQAVRIAGDIALRWNEGTLPQPPPLSTFAHVMSPAVAPGWTTAPPQPARSESSEWERRYRQAEIAQQDAAYEASVARDREAQEAQRAAEQTEARAQEEQERLEAARAEAMALATSRVGDEPTDAAAFAIVVKLPNGSRITRKFISDDTVQLLLDWIHSEVDPGDTGYELWFGFPSQRLWVLEADNVATHFGAPELEQTLAAAGIQPREIVELRNLD